jgi:hypothetical protein
MYMSRRVYEVGVGVKSSCMLKLSQVAVCSGLQVRRQHSLLRNSRNILLHCRYTAVERWHAYDILELFQSTALNLESSSAHDWVRVLLPVDFASPCIDFSNIR